MRGTDAWPPPAPPNWARAVAHPSRSLPDVCALPQAHPADRSKIAARRAFCYFQAYVANAKSGTLLAHFCYELPVRIIKKYPNRRLYDTSQSSYVTLDDVKDLVLKGEEFQVIESRSKEDITRSVLLQIISEQEAQDGAPLFTNQVLQQLIRFYGDSLQGLMGEYLEKSVSMFMEQQETLRKQVQTVMDANPFSVMSKIAEQNLSMWQSFAKKPREDAE
jgi:polyhydroxyalkanoate synthesis repressor PhaR